MATAPRHAAVAAAGTSRKAKLIRTIKIGAYGVAGVVALLLLTMWVSIGPSTDPDKRTAGGAAPPAPRVAAPAIPSGIARVCDGLRKSYTFGPTPVLINAEGTCSGELYYSEQDVRLYARRPNSTKWEGPFNRGQTLPDDTEWIKNEGKSFPAQVALVPSKRYTENQQPADRGRFVGVGIKY